LRLSVGKCVAAVVAAITLWCADSDDDFGSESNSVCAASVDTATQSRGGLPAMMEVESEECRARRDRYMQTICK
jgi:hypothetical protein